MKLRNISLWFFILVLLMLSANTLFMVLIQQAYSSVLQAQDHRQKSIALSNELYQETEQLVRLVRAYTITGESRYLFYYYDILAIRQGEKAAPDALNPITYWDDVIAGKIQHKLPENGTRFSLAERMKQWGFGQAEFAAFDAVLKANRDMNQIEQIAFAATQGLYDPVKQEFISEGEPHLDYASQLVHGADYNLRKASLSHAVETLLSITDARTRAEVAHETSRLQNLIVFSLLSMAATIILVMIAFNTVRRRVLQPIQQLKGIADALTAGNYAARTEQVTNARSVEELRILGQTFDSMAQSIEGDIAVRLAAIQQTKAALDSVQKKNRQIMESIAYAKVIQAAVLPSTDLVDAVLGDHFILWEPKDIVGGDIYAVARVNHGVMVAVIDCTGHGVPGALMTMITMSSIKQIISEGSCRGPAEMLKKLNALIKLSLYHQAEGESKMDDGLEIGVCWFDFDRPELRFAGARFPLLVAYQGTLTVLEGDRAQLGYKDVNVDYVFSERTMPLLDGQRFYLYSDGFVDQVGTNNFPFGRRKLHQLIQENVHKPMSEQGKIYRHALATHQGAQKRRDDVTIIGWEVRA
ncbi:MAG: SpoIIE family protein phosphatase [Gallionella sp.]|nr:SpoIIE family protein phosphatase [Gallionella sp.]